MLGSIYSSPSPFCSITHFDPLTFFSTCVPFTTWDLGCFSVCGLVELLHTYMPLVSQRLEDRWWNFGPYRLLHQHVLCSGLCPGPRALGTVCGDCGDQHGLSELCVLPGESIVKGAGALVSGCIGIANCLLETNDPQSSLLRQFIWHC